TVQVKSTVAETKLVLASVRQKLFLQTSVDFTSLGAVATVEATPSTVVADDVASANIKVTLKDLGGKPMANRDVTLDVSGTGNHFAPLPATDAKGVTQTSLRSVGAETKTLTALVDGVPVGQASVTFTPTEPQVVNLMLTRSSGRCAKLTY